MFNLIDESGKDLSEFGYSVKDIKYDAKLAFMEIDTEKKAENAGLGIGKYFIINMKEFLGQPIEFYDYFASICKNCLQAIFKLKHLNSKKHFLIVGLGNPDILADRLGAHVTNKLENNDNLYKFCPNIAAFTNIKTFDFVSYIQKGVKADALILIDALATNEISRLGLSIQITSSGLTPGSGVGEGVKRICQQTLGVPCISIGVPYMLFASALDKNAPQSLLLSPKDIHEDLDFMAYVISKSINDLLKK